jgi:hypothetical protein
MSEVTSKVTIEPDANVTVTIERKDGLGSEISAEHLRLSGPASKVGRFLRRYGQLLEIEEAAAKVAAAAAEDDRFDLFDRVDVLVDYMNDMAALADQEPTR